MEIENKRKYFRNASNFSTFSETIIYSMGPYLYSEYDDYLVITINIS